MYLFIYFFLKKKSEKINPRLGFSYIENWFSYLHVTRSPLYFSDGDAAVV